MHVLNNILAQFHDAPTHWHDVLMVYGNWLFIKLATLNLIWLGVLIVVYRRGSDFGISALVGHAIQTLFSWMLWLNGDTWIPAIINSFAMIGQKASGVQSLDPSSIVDKAIAIGADMFGTMGFWGTMAHPLTATSISFAGIIAFLAMVVVAIHMVYVIIRAQLVIAFAPFMLAFGGSRWTIHITEKYLSHVISVGATILGLFCVIGLAETLTQDWAVELNARAGKDMTIFMEVIVGAILYAVLCWLTPSWIAEMFSGAIGLTMSEIERSLAMVYARVPGGSGGGSSPAGGTTPLVPPAAPSGGGSTPKPPLPGSSPLTAAWNVANKAANPSTATSGILNQFRNAGTTKSQAGPLQQPAQPVTSAQQQPNLAFVKNPQVRATLAKFGALGKQQP